jgi:hypothetical protein
MKRASMAVSTLVFVFVVMFVGCKKAEPPSPIVKKLEDAGAGDLSNSSSDDIARWMSHHWDDRKEVILEVKKDCLAIRDSMPVNWQETTEGRVCKAAYGASVRIPLQTDDKKF